MFHSITLISWEIIKDEVITQHLSTHSYSGGLAARLCSGGFARSLVLVRALVPTRSGGFVARHPKGDAWLVQESGRIEY